MPWAVLSFILSMFLMVEALSYRGWLDWIADALGRGM
jgi:Na+/H+ antiporter NhaD/arsenite permease-like protein